MPSPRSPLSRLFTVLLAGLLAGLVLALAALPGGLLGGFAARAALGAYAELPDALRTPVQPQRSYLYANDGKTLITTFYDVNRTDVPLAEIAPVMRQAIIAAEDRRFYSHGGADLRGIARALVANVKGGGTEQGGSTLTMQYVRNVLKTDPNRTPEERQAATEQTVGRKLQEIRYANALEQSLSKDEILNRYLNIAYFGSGAYGVAAASQRYFGKAPADLTLGEAALLAGLVQSPDAYSPIDGDKDQALTRRGYVLDAMAETGAITAQQAAAAKAEALTLRPTAQPNGCTATAQGHDDWGFFCDYLRRWWITQPAFGSTPEEREQALRRGGYRVVTTLDPKIQETAQEQATKVYGYGNKRALPIAAVEPGTGRVLAMAVNRHYSLDANPDGQANHPNTVNPLISGGASVDGYQAGSTFKMFTMLAALEAGKPLSTGFDAPSRLPTRYASDDEGNCDGTWCPANANPQWMDGYRMIWDGFGRSVNTYFVWLAEQVGEDKVVEMAQRLGITFRADSDAAFARDNAANWGAFTLGVAATTPLDLANAYATVAAEGTYCTPLPVVSVTAPDGDAVDVAQPSCKRVLEPDVARAATDAARCPVGQQSAFEQCNGGTATAVDRIVGRPVAGKTGSSERNATETFVGYTPQVAVAGIAANPDDVTDLVGSAVQAKVIDAVARTIKTALTGKPVADFTAPSRALVGDPQRPQPPRRTEPDRREQRQESELPSDVLRWLRERG
ncbi:MULTISPECIES: transglycosylase domain-containing protein [unclassified Micromonospora]|uniref:transglycosylase domain-containing protein n=1 Tax=unclassified Micromonospora TaxID=2617518 RepID=UPI001E431A42|nr:MULTISPECIES: transglycosylase domain-containing protein [unclassified Micromonospora]MCZ7476365.1 transglycosylase domain-containing protein [Micromonospora sp. WMMC273]WBC01203.1 transglycosylase domain-containing protein [Micromonospora sp. WMMA1976]